MQEKGSGGSSRRNVWVNVLIAVLLAALALVVVYHIVFPVHVSRSWTGVVVDPENDFAVVDTADLSFDGTWNSLFSGDNWDYEGTLTYRVGGAEGESPLYARKLFEPEDGWQSLSCFAQVVHSFEYVAFGDQKLNMTYRSGKLVAGTLYPDGDWNADPLLLIAGEGDMTEAELVDRARTIWP